MKESSQTTPKTHAERILRVLVHIQQNLDSTLSLEELAAVARYSPFHFHRVFRGMVGESVKQHIRRLRLERAAMRLKRGGQPVTMIAFEAGYEAHEAFTRAFNQAFGCSPSQFRKTAGPTGRLQAPSGVHYVAAKTDVSFVPLVQREEPMNVKIKTLAPIRVAFLRHVGPYDQVGETWERLCDWAGAQCLFGPRSELFGACYDDPEVTPPEKVRYDACIAVDDRVEAEGEIGIQTFGGGRYACTLHEGPYHRLGETYAALLGRWFAARDCEPGEPPCLEFYLNDPESTEPENLLTEVCVRVQE